MRELLHAARTPVQDYSGPELVAERKSVLVGTGERKTSGGEAHEGLAWERSDNAPVLPISPDITGGSL